MSAGFDLRHWRRAQIRLVHIDGLIAAALVVDLVLESALGAGVHHRLATALFAVPFAAPVALRRRWPTAAILGATGASLLQGPFRGQLFTLPSGSAVLVLMLCSYGVGAWLERRPSVLTMAAACVLLVTGQLIETQVTHVSGGGPEDLALLLLAFIVPWLAGRFINQRDRRAEAFSLLATQVATQRTERERAAVAEERLMIGAELQDIIAHSVSVMVVQAGGARRLLREEPDRARASILTVEQTGREALAEMRRMLGLLRRDDDPQALTPQPGLDQLPELTATLRNEGLTCILRTDGQPIELTPGIDLVSYRVIETALEQAAASRCRRATATVRYRRRQLELEVRGDREGSYRSDDFRSVSERVGLYGGTVDIDDSEPFEFAVRCLLPVEVALSS